MGMRNEGRETGYRGYRAGDARGRLRRYEASQDEKEEEAQEEKDINRAGNEAGRGGFYSIDQIIKLRRSGPSSAQGGNPGWWGFGDKKPSKPRRGGPKFDNLTGMD